jgi:hypothetical protein
LTTLKGYLKLNSLCYQQIFYYFICQQFNFFYYLCGNRPFSNGKENKIIQLAHSTALNPAEYLTILREERPISGGI